MTRLLSGIGLPLVMPIDDFGDCGFECYDTLLSTCWCPQQLIGLISSTLSLLPLNRAWHPVYTQWHDSVKLGMRHAIPTYVVSATLHVCTWSLSSPSLPLHSPRDKHHMCESSSLDVSLLYINTLSMKQYRCSLEADVFHSCVSAILGHILYIMWSSRRKSHIAWNSACFMSM